MTNRREVLGGAGVLTLVSFAGCLSDLENDEDDEETDDSESAQTDNSADPEDISEQYGLGLSSVESGKLGIGNGITEFNIGTYEMASDSFENAKETFQRAEDEFSEAVDLTYEVDNSDAREICERAESHAATLRNAAEQYQQAAEAAEENRGNDVVNSRLEQAESLETEAEQSPPRDQSTLDSVLDLN